MPRREPSVVRELRFLTQDSPVRTFHHAVSYEPIAEEPTVLPLEMALAITPDLDLYYEWLVPWRRAGRP